MPGGPPTYGSKEEERETEEKIILTHQKIADAFSGKLEEILKDSNLGEQQRIAEAVQYVLGGWVYGYHPAGEKIKSWLKTFNPQYEETRRLMEETKKRIRKAVFKANI